MSRLPRKAMPSSEREFRTVTAKAITSDTLEGGGKAPSASLPGGSGIKSAIEVEPYEEEDEDEDEGEMEESTKLFVPIIKASDEQRTVTGVVLQPEETDAHGDIYDGNVVRSAAWDFLEGYQDTTKLGLMHKNFAVNFGLLESYIAPHGIVINGKTVKEGSWIMTVRVKDDKIWKLVKEGKITGFSIGGKAKVKQLVKE